MAIAKILVVDDDPAIRNLIVRFLSHEKDYQIESAQNGRMALETFDSWNPDLVILDLNLPDVNGKTLCKEMQDRTGVFVLILTSSNDTSQKINLFGQGADDYLTKPFDLQELKCRVEALLRRFRDKVTQITSDNLVFGNLAICLDRREVKINDSAIQLTALEFDLLHCLAKHPGKVWRREQLIQAVWKYDYVGDQRVVDVHIGQIRKKIEVDSSHPSMIQTVRGVGYKFEAAADN